MKSKLWVIISLYFLLERCNAFSAATGALRWRSSGSPRIRATAARYTDAEVPVARVKSASSDQEEVVKSRKIELDSHGNLCMDDGSLILNGLTRSVWSASSPYGPDSLFLHTSYSENKAEHTSRLGNLIACERLLACARVTRYWMGPKFGTSARDVPFDTQFLLVEISRDGPYALFLPLVNNGFRASLFYDKNSIDLVCAAESGDVDVTTSSMMQAVYVGVGDDPYKLIQKSFSQVADATGTFQTLDKKALPPSVDKFGWCTWDAFYSKVTPEGVLEGVKALREAGTPPKTVILDDGWQTVDPSPPEQQESDGAIAQKQSFVFSLASKAVTGFYEKFVRKARHGSKGNRIWRFLSKSVLKDQLWKYFDTETDFNRQLSSFSPNEKFQGSGKSLKDLISRLKNEFEVKNVYCWHALHGYWRGVSEQLGRKTGLNVTNVVPNPSYSLLRLEPQLAWDTVSLFGVGLISTASDLEKFYEHLHSPLVQAGVDGVKVDVQSGVSAVGGGLGGGPHLAKLYTNAMEESVSKRFIAENGAANCINCMCHSTENLYRYKHTAVARASDDFYPDRPNSHTVHLINVAYNSLFIGAIALPDWDMFHSLHESAGLHAAARAVGGCPVYVSDKPGMHDPEILKKLVLPDGSVLRALRPGTPTRDCLFANVGADGVSALKIWNENRFGGVIGAFHVQGVAWNFDTHENEVIVPKPQPLKAVVRPHDIETLRGHAGPFSVWKFGPQRLEFLPSGNDSLEVSLNHRDWEVFSVIPLQVQGDLLFGPIGLAKMLNSGGAILSNSLFRDLSTTKAMVTSRGPGRFVAFANRQPSAVSVNGVDVDFDFKKEDCELSLILPEELPEGNPHNIVFQWA